jgi:bifunctional non-homologous end joining protein LigD
MPAVRSVRLFFQEGSSDKLYEADIVEDDGAYTVRVAWGRRGSKLNQGNKAVRVSLDAATRKLESLIREKRAKGYEEITAEVQPAAVAPPAGEGSGSRATGQRAKVGHAAQLLNPIDDDELERFLADDEMVAQQKIDGQRVLATVEEDGSVTATNRNGQRTEVPEAVLAGLALLPLGTVVDGELVGDITSGVLWLFDVLAVGGDDVRDRGFIERWSALEGDLEPALAGRTAILPVAIGAATKRLLHDRLRAASAEGMVFKHRDAPYTSGRPTAGGPQRKHKFIKSAEVVILENAGNAYLMGVYDGRTLVEVGKVFAGTTNDSRAELDARLGVGQKPVVEVRYLYATAERQLYQPVFVGLRDDKDATGCGLDQLVGTSRTVISLTGIALG